MKRNSILMVVVICLLALAFLVYHLVISPSRAQPTVAIFNYVSHPILDDSVTGIKEGLAAGGFEQGKIKLVEINAGGAQDKLNAFANELLQAKPMVIIPVSTPVTQAVFEEAGPDQKIVFSTVTNPSDVGMDKKPPNMTGVCDVVNYKANLDLIFELFPNTERIGMVYNAGERNSQFGVDKVKQLTEDRKIEFKVVPISNSGEVEDAAKALVDSVDVFYVGSDNTVVGAIAALLSVAYDRKVPVIASDSGSVEKGALAAVSVDYEELGKRVGALVARILETGRMPAQMEPIMYSGETILLNSNAAQKLGIEFPRDLKGRAKRIID